MRERPLPCRPGGFFTRGPRPGADDGRHLFRMDQYPWQSRVSLSAKRVGSSAQAVGSAAGGAGEVRLPRPAGGPWQAARMARLAQNCGKASSCGQPWGIRQKGWMAAGGSGPDGAGSARSNSAPHATRPSIYGAIGRGGHTRRTRGSPAPPHRASSNFLKLGALLRQDGSLHRAHLQADAAVDAGVEVNPVEARPLAVGPLPGVDAGHRAGIDAIGDAFADVGDDRMGHRCGAEGATLGTQPQGPGATTGAGHCLGSLPAR
jgi:hypothetical protein